MSALRESFNERRLEMVAIVIGENESGIDRLTYQYEEMATVRLFICLLCLAATFFKLADYLLQL